MGWLFLSEFSRVIHHRGQGTQRCRFTAQDPLTQGTDLQACFPGLLHNGKLRIQHPGTGNTEPKLAELVDDGSGNLSTVIPANSWGKVLVKLNWKARNGRVYIMALHTDGRELSNGAVFYFGNSEKEDIYTGDVSNWNEEHGVVGLYEKFKKKNPILSQ